MAVGLAVSVLLHETFETFQPFTHYFHLQLMSFFIRINGAKSHYWPLEICPRGYWCRIQLTWVRCLPFFSLLLQKKPFQSLNFPCGKWQKVLLRRTKKKDTCLQHHLSSSMPSLLSYKNIKRERGRDKVSRLFDGLGLWVSFLHHQIHYQTFLRLFLSTLLVNGSISRPFHENADALVKETEKYKTAYEVELTSDSDTRTFYQSEECHRQRVPLTLKKFLLFYCRKT